ncbi:MAG: DUF4238 domain-containing protein [Methanobrevibacter sp.]|nr:DUF4238 domain-containing protein [Methanobrevibacter sp.]
MDKIKKKQHYVWRKYLKPWTQDNKIWCKMNEKIFQTSLVNIGNETYFYEVDRLNETEEKIIYTALKIFPKENLPVLMDILANYRLFSEHSDISRKNGLENYHNFIENMFDPILENVYKRDLAFLKNDYYRANFSYFIGLQYTRTKKSLRNLQEGFNYIPTPDEIKGNFNPETISRIFGLIIAESIGNWMHSKSNIYFFESDNELMTSDQPIINIRANYKINSVPKRIELYYPLTPNLALFITDRTSCDRILKREDTKFLNYQIKIKSYEQLYSKAHNTLIEYK